jgi:hypothetical protein
VDRVSIHAVWPALEPAIWTVGTPKRMITTEDKNKVAKDRKDELIFCALVLPSRGTKFMS